MDILLLLHDRFIHLSFLGNRVVRGYQKVTLFPTCAYGACGPWRSYRQRNSQISPVHFKFIDFLRVVALKYSTIIEILRFNDFIYKPWHWRVTNSPIFLVFSHTICDFILVFCWHDIAISHYYFQFNLFIFHIQKNRCKIIRVRISIERKWALTYLIGL